MLQNEIDLFTNYFHHPEFDFVARFTMENTNPTFSILIVNYNGLSHLDECLSSVYMQGFTDFEVVLVDNGSRDESLAFLKQNYPQVKIIASKTNLGFSGGNNFGIPHCNGKFIFFLNNDTKLEQNGLQILYNEIQANPEISVFACFLISYREPSKVDSAGDTIYSWGSTFSFSGYPVTMFVEPRFVTSACAGAAVYKKEVLSEIGFFDDDFFLNFEDIDLSLRAQHAGFRILFLSNVKVFHKGSATLGGKKSRTSLFFAERNFSTMVLKNFPIGCLIRFFPALLFIKIASLRTCIANGFLGSYLKANIEAARLLPKTLKKRRHIQAKSVLTSPQFWNLLRKNWVKERIKFHRGEYDIPL